MRNAWPRDRVPLSPCHRGASDTAAHTERRAMSGAGLGSLHNSQLRGACLSSECNAVMVAESYTPLYEKWIKKFPDPEDKLNQIVNKIPLEKRMTTPKEIANTVAFLMSEKSSHTTGQLMHVDGGYVHLDRSLNASL